MTNKDGRILIMKGSKVLRVLLAGIMICSIGTMTGCKEDLPPYESIVQAIDTYRTNYYEYCRNDDPARENVSIESASRRDGTPCRSYYVKSGDGKYISVNLEYEKNNTTMVDEYYYLSDKAFYIANSYLDSATMSPVVTQYYVWHGDMYLIDPDSSSLKEADASAAAEYYTSFDDIIRTYGTQSR